jgi:hypothetical protein
MIAPAASPHRAMRRIIFAAVGATTGTTLALIMVALILPARAEVALRWYLVGVGAIAAATAIRALITRYPVQWQVRFDPSPRPDRPPEEVPARLRTIHRLISRSRWDPVGFDQELRPILGTIAAQRLATYCTIDIDREPEKARAVLGARVWDLLFPEGSKAARAERAVDLVDLRAAVEALETLHDHHHPHP